MQPIGQALAQLVGLFVLLGWNNVKHLDSRQCGLDSLRKLLVISLFTVAYGTIKLLKLFCRRSRMQESY